ncbi:SH3 domain-containing protein [Salaquimonas pukyongi]|uniref:SH3 domain-containing protein n=1 Tax=Salaquimonas pukyongi TaxID=2712698 RepID=UPI00096B8B47|nr:SH3 domain-containing protein [Salaquimonas pukyongi]
MLPADFKLSIDLLIVCAALAAAFFWSRSASLRPPDLHRITTFTNPDDSGRLPIGVWTKRIAGNNKKAAAFAALAALLGAGRLSLDVWDVEGAVTALMTKPPEMVATTAIPVRPITRTDEKDPRSRIYMPKVAGASAVTLSKPPVREFNRIVTANRLNVRSGPGANHQLLATLNRGEKVLVDRTEGNWSYLSSDGLKGWAYSKYLSPGS